MTAMEQKNLQHIGIIMDGNRRWARELGKPTLAGHREGVEALKRVGDWCLAHNIPYLTVWAFSTENWSRPKQEVSYLMKLIKQVAIKEIDEFMKRGAKLNIIGRLHELPAFAHEAVDQAMEKTKNNTAITLNVGINYGGRAEIIDAIKKMITAGITAAKVTEELVRQFLYLPDVPDPDLIIRASGEKRTSGFLLWEMAYAELFFSPSYWPDFGSQQMDEALANYHNRQRRFGG